MFNCCDCRREQGAIIARHETDPSVKCGCGAPWVLYANLQLDLVTLRKAQRRGGGGEEGESDLCKDLKSQLAFVRRRAGESHASAIPVHRVTTSLCHLTVWPNTGIIFTTNTKGALVVDGLGKFDGNLWLPSFDVSAAGESAE